MANEVIPYYEPGGEFTVRCTAAVFGKRFLMVDAADAAPWAPEGLKSTASANVVPAKQATAGAKVIGVAQRDAQSGSLVTTMAVPGMVVPVTSSAAVNPGDEVQSDAVGKAVVVSTGKPAGIALSKATGADQDLAVRLY